MATPIGHGVFGIALLRLAGRESSAPNLYLYGFALFAANAPDLDFIPGFFMGDANAFHQGPSHSMFAVALFSLISIFLAKPLNVARWRMALMAFLTYGSHLLLDLFVQDKRDPVGIPLAWPFSGEYWHAPFDLFMGIKHGVPGDSATDVFFQIFSLHNLLAISRELLFIGPILLLVILLTRKQWQPVHGQSVT